MTDVSVVTSTGWSPKGPEFNSQHLHGGSQQSVTPVPEDQMLLLASTGTVYMWYPYIYIYKAKWKKDMKFGRHVGRHLGEVERDRERVGMIIIHCIHYVILKEKEKYI